jgi:hypothetical protein
MPKVKGKVIFTSRGDVEISPLSLPRVDTMIYWRRLPVLCHSGHGNLSLVTCLPGFICGNNTKCITAWAHGPMAHEYEYKYV